MADGFDFSPLPEGERERAAQEWAGDAEADAIKPTLPPADAGPPEVAAARLFHRKPDGLWRYATAEGATAFHICRWNKPDGDKEIRPLSWFEGEGWQLRAWPAPRPLYNLDKIAANPDAPIVVCEGEKSADAAERIFPGWIAATSSGGSPAASQTDWTPLRGRRALIWPDADQPGSNYALQVAAILAGLDCDVETIDAAALAAIDPNGGAREPEKGWDAADALAEWMDLEALRKAAEGDVKPFDPGPAYVCHGAYTMDADGLTVEVKRGTGNSKQTETVRISAAFEIVGLSRDPRGQAWGKMLRWRDADGRTHERHVTDAALHGDLGALCGVLADEGLRIDRKGQRHLVDYLCIVQVTRRVTVVPRTGWHEFGGRSYFALPVGTIGPHGAKRVILDATARGPYEARGTIQEWRDGVAKLASGQALLVHAISSALMGPLLHLAEMEGGGVHYFGPSSIGKTTALRLAASVWGPPGFVRSWRATSNGLEGAAASATDTALILDELSQVEARDLAAALYSLANGAGKQRSHRDGSLREPRAWRVPTISSGELPIEAKLAEDRGRKSRAGQLVRMLDIPADRGLGFGMFDHAGPDGDAAAFAKACKLAASSVYGTAGPEFVRVLISERVTGDDARAFVKEFLATHVPAGADGQIVRAAERLALIASAGELATEFGMTDWREGEARAAAACALKQWIEVRGGLEPAEVRQAIEHVRHFIEAHGDARFVPVDSADDPDARPVHNRAGWRKGAGDDRRWFVLPEVWRSEICAGLDPKLVAKVLADRDMLEKGSDGNARVVSIAGRSQRVYVLTARILDGGER